MNHDYWNEGQFECINLENKKSQALCKICASILKNTSQRRLMAHRERCPPKRVETSMPTTAVTLTPPQQIPVDTQILPYRVGDEQSTSLALLASMAHIGISAPSSNQHCSAYFGDSHNMLAAPPKRNEKDLFGYQLTQAHDKRKKFENSCAHTDMYVRENSQREMRRNKNYFGDYSTQTEFPASSASSNGHLVPSSPWEVRPQSPVSEVIVYENTIISKDDTESVPMIKVAPSEAFSSSNEPSHTQHGLSSNENSDPSLTGSFPHSTILYPPHLCGDRHHPVSNRDDKNAAVIRKLLDSITQERQIEVDKALAKFFYAASIPFSIIESPFFRNFIQEIRPAYLLPTVQTLATKLLDDVYADTINYDGNYVPKKSVLLFDIWRNTINNQKEVITMLHTADGSAKYLGSFDLTSNETAEELGDLCLQAIRLAAELYGSVVYAVVSDSAPNMLKMQQNLKCQPEIIHSMCNSHCVGILVRDICSRSNDGRLQRFDSTLREFRDASKVSGAGLRINIPDEYRDLCLCFVANLAAMKDMAAQGRIALRTESRETLRDDQLFNEVMKLISITEPLALLIEKCKSLRYSIADSSEDWLRMSLPLEFCGALKAHKLLTLNKFSLTANYLHPQFKGRAFDRIQKDTVNAFLLQTLNVAGVESLRMYQKDEGIFRSLNVKFFSQPLTYWYFAQNQHENLADMAVRLLNIPASLTQLKRVFSSWSLINLAAKNRELQAERSKKLIHIYYSLRLRKEHCRDGRREDGKHAEGGVGEQKQNEMRI